MKKTLFILLLIIISISCNKNQKAVRKLDGKWELESTEVSTPSSQGSVVSMPNEGSRQVYEFNSCKDIYNKYCTSSYITYELDENGNEITESIELAVFKIIGDGNRIEMKSNSSDIQSITLIITELNKDDLILMTYFDTQQIKYYFKKIED